MKRDDHEAILAELLNPETPHDKRTDLLSTLRADYNGVLGDFENLTKTTEELSKERNELVLANSKLFRQSSYTEPEEKQKEEEKALSETITIEDIERGIK